MSLNISINGSRATSGFVSVTGLAERLGTTEQDVLTRAKAKPIIDGGRSWLRLEAKSVEPLVRDAGLGEATLFTARGAVKSGYVTKPAADAALKGAQTLFLSSLHAPADELSVFQAAGKAVRVEAAKASVAKVGSGGSALLRGGVKLLPFALGAAPVALGVTYLARRIGSSSLESTHDKRVRRAGMLVGATTLGSLTGASLALAVRKELPVTSRVAWGVAIGGAVLAPLAYGAIKVTNGDGGTRA